MIDLPYFPASDRKFQSARQKLRPLLKFSDKNAPAK